MQSIMIKKSEHKVMDLKLSLSSHLDIWIGHRPFLFRKILVLLCTILPIDCLSYFSFLPMFIQQPININLFSLINSWDNNYLTIVKPVTVMNL